MGFEVEMVAKAIQEHGEDNSDIILETLLTYSVSKLISPSDAICATRVLMSVVINYDFPTGVEDYVHRIGRTGRAGATGVAYTYFGDQDARYASDLIKVLEGANQRVPPEIRDMASRGGGGGGMGRFRRWSSGGRGGRNDSSYGGRDGGRGGWGFSSSSSSRLEKGGDWRSWA
ncbi:hypothetical protein FNV43_RR14096 [Rhamnella rubrinervis]|uniref:Helicase C-terminal domain-containing protein n=1 Tax=Rhamnella rubrinervis TaxID=2594499 RepID=A0A8K0H2E8_9ROSA|nr:hypothetical protein FNV43_RR14096 [Rhamnella rubrinervis]